MPPLWPAMAAAVDLTVNVVVATLNILRQPQPDESGWLPDGAMSDDGPPRQHAEFHPPPQGGLADGQAGERARRVEVMVGQEPQRFQPVIAEEVAFLDDQDGGASALGVFGGERAGGLRSQGGVMGQGLATK
jgi:hypothetical protein